MPASGPAASPVRAMLREGITAHSLSTKTSPHLSQELHDQIRDLVNQGILEESEGTWSSPICLVKKKSGAYRMVADLRRLNAVSKVPVYQIPRVDDC